MTAVSTLAALMLLAAACGSGPAQAPSTTSEAITTSAPVEETTSQVFELMAVSGHPNGAQVRVDRIELLADSTVVSAVVTNGSRFGISLGRGTTELVTDDGRSIPLIERPEVGTLEPGAEAPLTLRFEPVPDASAVTLLLNRGGGSSPSDPNTSSPSFEVGPLALDQDATRPALPEPVPLRRTAVDVAGAGVELQIEGINFTENRIGVWVRISNPLPLEVRIAPTIAPTVVRDDLGNRYPLVLPEGETWISVPAGTARSGTLSFAGRIDPAATMVDFGIHAGTDGVRDQDVLYPAFVVRDISFTGDTATAPLPGSIGVGEEMQHPAGVRMTVRRIAFSDTATEVSVEIADERVEAVTLASSATYLADDLGMRHPLVPLAGNPRLMVEPGTAIEATLAFSGRIGDDAGAVSLVFNGGGSANDPDTTEPAFTFGPYELSRPGGLAEPIVARVFPVGPTSILVPDELAVSEVQQITETLTRFGAEEIEGGFQLTLPDSILFDFGSDELRPDAVPALTLVAEVLRYFEGDPVIIVGHTDSIGDPATNQRLSERRARTVVDALVRDHGIDAGRLTAEGRGATEPVAPNTTPDGADDPEGRQLNRRVEIVVLTDRALPLP
jgi:outer membrane protein OmpA-like peptidoglycan-associated protein